MAAMILCLAVRVPSLAEGAPTLELRPSVSTVQPGGEFTVDLVIHNNPGIAGIRFVFQYDEALLQLKEVTFDKKTFDWEVCYKEDPTRTDEVSREGAAWAQKTNWTGNDCSILQLTFRVLENAPMDTVTTIGITDLDIMNASLQEVPFTAAPAIVTIQEEPPGVTVSGTATSWNNTDNAVYLLYLTDTSNADIKAEWKNGNVVKALNYIVEKDTPTASGKQYTQKFSFAGVPEGTYKLAILKPDKYVPKIITITVGASDYSCGEQKLWLYGDVNYDGKVKVGDAVQVLRYIAELRTFTEEQEQSADVTQDGKVKVGDVTQIKRYIAELDSKMDNLK